jgi:hypothetical protein
MHTETPVLSLDLQIYVPAICREDHADYFLHHQRTVDVAINKQC